MSAGKVNVLAAMDEAAQAIEKAWAQYEGPVKLIEARAAVAELIEAANVLEANASRPSNGLRYVNDEDINHLRAALAAVQP